LAVERLAAGDVAASGILHYEFLDVWAATLHEQEAL
jgi:hypothetical protein